MAAKFRHNSSIAILGLTTFCAAIFLATSRWYLLPILLVPLALTIWGWRSGTDIDERGIRVRALLGSRRWGWAEIDGFTPDGRRVVALLRSGRAVPLPAVTPQDVPRLLAASRAATGESVGSVEGQ